MATLETLPLDVLLELGDWLTLSDRALLATSCRKMYEHFGSCLKQVREDQNGEHRFSYRLVLYDRLHPHQLLCPACCEWHAFELPDDLYNCLCSSLEIDKEIPRYGAPWAQGLLKLTHIPWPAVQAAVRAVRLGPSFGISLDDLWEFFRRRAFLWYVADQYKFVVADGHLLSQCSMVKELSVLECPHLRQFDSSTSPLESLFSCAQTHIDAHAGTDDCWTCSKSYRCSQCPSEWSVRIVPESRDVADEERVAKDSRLKRSLRITALPTSLRNVVQLTRYIDLGDGMSPWAEEWRQLSPVADDDMGKGRLLPQGKDSLRDRFSRAAA